MIHETYCSYPFDSLAVKKWQDGLAKKVTPCCNMKNGRADDKDPMRVKNLIGNGATLLDVFHSKQFDELRDNLLNGVKHNACEYCWRLESKTGKSPRTVEISKLKQAITTPKLNKFDTMLDENCNLRCRMCTPACSNSLRKDVTLIKQSNLTMPEYMAPAVGTREDQDPNGVMSFNSPDDTNQKQLVELCNTHLEELKFTGGEPTTSATFWKIVDNIERPQDMILNVTTNGTKFNDKFINAIKKFKFNKITVSIDGTHKTYEYIRYPFNWRKLEQNIERLCNKMEEGRLDLMFCSVLTIYNILNIRNLIDWIHHHNMDTVHPIHFNCIVDPHPVDSCLDVKWASKELLDIAHKNIQVALEESDKHTVLHITRLRDYLKWCLEAEHDPEYRNQRRQRLLMDTTTFDKIRNQNYENILNPPVVDFIKSI